MSERKTMEKKMTGKDASVAIASALAAVEFLYASQMGLLKSDVKAANGRIEEGTFQDAKDVKASEAVRAKHERLVKSLQRAKAHADAIAQAEDRLAEMKVVKATKTKPETVNA